MRHAVMIDQSTAGPPRPGPAMASAKFNCNCKAAKFKARLLGGAQRCLAKAGRADSGESREGKDDNDSAVPRLSHVHRSRRKAVAKGEGGPASRGRSRLRSDESE